VTDARLARTTFRGFLFADLRGYSDYVEAHGDQGGVELLERYRQLVRAAISPFEGAEIRTEGDSFYVVFPSASSAVSCAMSIVAGATKADPLIPVGIGIHAGEAADTGEGPVGSAVNIAARVCSRAAAGEVLVTDTVRAVTRSVLPYRYVPRGTPALKGITEPIPLFSVVEADGTTPVVGRRRRLRGVPRSTPVLAALFVLAVLAIGLAAAALGLPGGSATPTATPTTSPLGASPSPSPALVSPAPSSTPALTAAEADLVARMAGLTDEPAQCRSATPEEKATGATTSVVCSFSATDWPSALQIDLFAQPPLMFTAFSAIATAHGGSTEDCATAPAGYSEWSVPRVSQGHVLCYPSGGDSHIAWTYEGGDGAGIMGQAVRHDVLWQQLYAWWQQFHPLVTH
jgi:class 3 adenylate cyclase